MLVIPIENEGRILNVSIKLSNIKKIENTNSFLNSGPSNIIINKKIFSESIYYAQKIEPSVIVDFIYNNNMHTNAKDFYVTTKPESTSDEYGVYEVMIPKIRIGKAFDNLFGACIIDLCNENLDSIKGRNISLEKYGISNHITEERLDKLKYLANNLDNLNAKKYIEENNLQDLIDTIEFLSLFNCTVIPKTAINCQKIESMIIALEKTSTNMYKELKKYYNIAKSNAKVYSKIAKLYHIIYNKPCTWIHNTKEKVKQKTIDETNNKEAA